MLKGVTRETINIIQNNYKELLKIIGCYCLIMAIAAAISFLIFSLPLGFLKEESAEKGIVTAVVLFLIFILALSILFMPLMTSLGFYVLDLVRNEKREIKEIFEVFKNKELVFKSIKLVFASSLIIYAWILTVTIVFIAGFFLIFNDLSVDISGYADESNSDPWRNIAGIFVYMFIGFISIMVVLMKKSLDYSQMVNILRDNEDAKVWEIIRESKKMMKGHILGALLRIIVVGIIINIIFGILSSILNVGLNDNTIISLIISFVQEAVMMTFYIVFLANVYVRINKQQEQE